MTELASTRDGERDGLRAARWDTYVILIIALVSLGLATLVSGLRPEDPPTRTIFVAGTAVPLYWANLFLALSFCLTLKFISVPNIVFASVPALPRYVSTFFWAWGVYALYFGLRLVFFYLEWRTDGAAGALFWALSYANDGFFLLTAALLGGLTDRRRQLVVATFGGVVLGASVLRGPAPEVSNAISPVLSLGVIASLSVALLARLRRFTPTYAWLGFGICILYGLSQFVYVFAGSGSDIQIATMIGAMFGKLILALFFIATVLLTLKEAASDRLRGLLDSCNIGHYRTDAAGRTISTSPAEERILGYESQELVDKPRHHLFADPQDERRFRQKLEASVRGRVEHELVALRNKDGQHVFVRAKSVRSDDEGSAGGHEAVYFDVTAEHEQMLFSRLRAAVASKLEPRLAARPGLDETLWAAVEALRSVEALPVRRGRLMLTSDSVETGERPAVFPRIDFSLGAVGNCQTEDLPPPPQGCCDGDENARDFVCVPLPTPRSGPLGCIWLESDERSIQPGLIERALAPAGETIVLALQEATNTLVNRAAEVLFGLIWQHEEAALYLEASSRSVADLLSVREACACYWDPTKQEWVSAQSETGRGVCGSEDRSRDVCPRVHSHGSPAPGGPHEATMTARLGSSEERPGWLLLRGRVDRVSQDDVSSFSLLDRRVAEFCARVLAQGMEFLVAEQRRLRWIDRTAHELTSPAAAIRSAADLLERRGSELSDAQSHRMLSLIDRACLQLVEKVDGLRRVRRLGKPREPVRPKLSRIELREDVLIPVVDEHYGYAKDNGVHLEARWTNAGVSPQLWVDREGMEVLFGNLVQNAVKYRNPQTQQCRIDITLCEEAGTWLVELADWGIGVAPELKDRIFEGGFRAPNAQQVAVTGSGHGLPIAREIAKAHLGDIRCRRTSRPTVFQVVLPRALESPDWWDNRTR